MSDSLDTTISEIILLKESKHYSLALDLCEKITKEHPNLLAGYRHKADILTLQKKKGEALDSTKKLAELDSQEPSDYYDLARRGLPFGYNDDVLSWCDKGIELCKTHNSTYYIQSLYFHRSCALMNMKRYAEVIESCNNIEDGYSVYFSGFGKKSKEEVLRQAENELEKQGPKVIRFD